VTHGRSPQMHSIAAGWAPKELSFGNKSEEQTANYTSVGTEQVGHLNAYIHAYCRVCCLLRQVGSARMRHQCDADGRVIP